MHYLLLRLHKKQLCRIDHRPKVLSTLKMLVRSNSRPQQNPEMHVIRDLFCRTGRQSFLSKLKSQPGSWDWISVCVLILQWFLVIFGWYWLEESTVWVSQNAPEKPSVHSHLQEKIVMNEFCCNIIHHLKESSAGKQLPLFKHWTPSHWSITNSQCLPA
jgi:hypothetical protein